jgi:replicative DNA helicase
MQKENAIPFNENAERAVLACMMQYDMALEEVLPLLTPDDFYMSRHATIYRAMCDLYNAGHAITAINVERTMGRDDDLFNFLVHLSEGVSFRDDALSNARIVAADSKRRKLMKYGNQVFGDAAHDPDADEVQRRAEQALFDLTNDHKTNNYSSLTEFSVEYLDMFITLEQKRGELSGLSTGFRSLDFLLRGMREQNMLVVAGRPGSGKSSLALTMAYSLSFKDKKRGVFFSLEMSKRELFERLVSMRAMVDSQALRTPWMLAPDERERVHRAIQDLESDSLIIDDTQALTTTDFRSKAKHIQKRGGLDYIIVDYLQLMRAHTSDEKRMKDRQQEVSEISMTIKAVAKELNVPIIALAQLNREVESRQSKVPQLSDLRESGAIEQDSDVVMFVYRDEMYNAESERKGQADIVIAKHRHGQCGEVTLHFEARLTQFTNLEVMRV